MPIESVGSDTFVNSPRDGVCFVDNTEGNWILANLGRDAVFNIATIGAFSSLVGSEMLQALMQERVIQVGFLTMGAIPVVGGAVSYLQCRQPNGDWDMACVYSSVVQVGSGLILMFPSAAPTLMNGVRTIINKIISRQKGTVGVEIDGAAAINAKSEAMNAARMTQAAEAPTPYPGCFLENTSIMLADGSYKNIQDILVGDEVMAFDTENNEPVTADVTATFIRDETKYLKIKYEAVE